MGKTLPDHGAFRTEYLIRVKCCMCKHGGFLVEVVAAQEITFSAHGTEFIRPLVYQLVNTDPEECQDAWGREVVTPSSRKGLMNDLLLFFRSINREPDNETVAVMKDGIDKFCAFVLEADMEELSAPN